MTRNYTCRHRGGGAYCSVGKTRGYIGLLDTAQQLKEALEATAFNKEVIIFAETRIADTAQMLARMRGHAGYAHVLAIMPEHRDCQRLARVMSPWQHEQGLPSCGSYSTADESGKPYETGFYYLAHHMGLTAWWIKWFTVARSVALGFNVMAVDSDTVVLDDWYWRAKQPPLSQYTLLSQAECPICINGGFSYIQNANPQGPVAWLFAEAVYRAVRWKEDWSAVAAISPKSAGDPNRAGMVDDQTMLSDVMYNCIESRPQFMALWYYVKDDPMALANLKVDNESDYRERVTPRDKFKDEIYTVNVDLATGVCEYLLGKCALNETFVTIRTAQLKMPHSGGLWPLDKGSYPFNRTLGPRAEAYRKAFRDLGVPLPPDPEDPATEAQARATKTELFGLLNIDGSGDRRLGGWAETVWRSAGRLGYWHTHLGPPPVQAVGHIHAGLWLGDFQKQVVMQAAGHHDWRVAARLGGGPSRAYYAAWPGLEAYVNAHQDKTAEIRRVVAYGPGVIGSGITKAQFLSATRGLAQVAVALGAVAAWPAVPCDAEWVLSKSHGQNLTRPIKHTIPWVHLNTEFAVIPFGESLDNLQCEWLAFSSADCLMDQRREGKESGRGLLALEFHHLTRRRELELATYVPFTTPYNRIQELLGLGAPLRHAPDKDNTLRLAASGPAADPVSPGSSAQSCDVSYGDLKSLNAERLLLHQQHHEPVPIFFLDRPVGQVTGLDGRAAAIFETWRQRCRVLRFNELSEYEQQLFG